MFSAAALAEPDDLDTLAASPQDYLGKEIEVTGYCVKGGVKGDVLGYECMTQGTVYVDTDAIEPADAEEKLNGSCKDKPQDSGCQATIRFVPHSFTTSNVLEPDRVITIFNTKKAELSF
ncbi:MAG TPA: hypothetical protein VNJ31_08670 [Methyloceanibacter sp.]|nr:hypothetical protein [Methyloceanibacter sp.]